MFQFVHECIAISRNGPDRARLTSRRLFLVWSRWNGLMLRKMSLHFVPIRAVTCELHVLRIECAWIIQATHVDCDDVWRDLWGSKQQAPAVGTEVANSL